MLDRRTLTLLCSARDALRDMRAPPPSIAALARDAGLSPYHFIRRFAAVFGETPHQLRIRARLDHAKLLLACADHSVTDVCFKVGFASLGRFSDAFARRVGVAPSAYRRTIRASIRVPQEAYEVGAEFREQFLAKAAQIPGVSICTAATAGSTRTSA